MIHFPTLLAPSSALRARRDFLYSLGISLGATALTALLQAEDKAATSPLAPRPPHHDAKAKACIFLFMEGGPSHIDTFDPKPKLAELHMQEFQRADKFASQMASGKRYYVNSPFKTRQVGGCGHWMSEFEHLPTSPTSCASIAGSRSIRSIIRPPVTR
jgi:hypothetical protein